MSEKKDKIKRRDKGTSEKEGDHSLYMVKKYSTFSLANS